jgi:hypothetical protein
MENEVADADGGWSGFFNDAPWKLVEAAVCARDRKSARLAMVTQTRLVDALSRQPFNTVPVTFAFTKILCDFLQAQLDAVGDET